MTRLPVRWIAVTAGIGILLASQLAAAQWVFVARRAIGRIEQMSQSQNNGPSYDSATVIVDAPADKVFGAVVRGVRAKDGIKITSETADARMIQFTNGTQIAGIKVAVLGDDLSQILVSSAHTGSQPDAAAMISDAVLRVCKELSVECSRAAN